jgi:acetyl-CoA acetyltransferase
MLHIGVELGTDVTAIYLEMVCASSQAEMALASSKVMVTVCAHVLAGYGSSHVL